MNLSAVPESIGRRFHRPPAPSVIARASMRQPIIFSHVASEVPMPDRTLAPPVEDSYSFHVHHRPIVDAEMWLEGRHRRLPQVDRGAVFIFDLRSEPIAQMHQPFEFSRFQISRALVEEHRHERGLRGLGELNARHGTTDPVVENLALAMIRRAEIFGDEVDTLFTDAMALAFCAHVVSVYGGAGTRSGSDGPLTPRQLRRVCDWTEAHLDAAISISELAALVGLSPSYFSRAFLRTTGTPPHRWLMQRRVARAKLLLGVAALPLSEIAASCGFVDQSHFTKVFSRIEGLPPARWRDSKR